MKRLAVLLAVLFPLAACQSSSTSSMAVSRSPSPAASFPSPQQELAFSVSPDGRDLLASRLTLPATTPPDPNGPPWPGFDPNSHWGLDLMAAKSGGPAETVSHQDLGTQFPRGVTEVVGWDSGGPLATLNSDLGTQQPPFSLELYGSPLVHLDRTGAVGPALAGTGPDCMPLSVLPDETVACTNSRFQALTVRSGSGAVLWAVNPSDTVLQPAVLSPDATMICGSGKVLTKASAVITLPGSSSDPFVCEGWLDAGTIVGTLGFSGNMGLVKVSDPTHPIDLSFKGDFVDVVTRP